jgi:NAD(P)H-nitrite reductase large subunit
MFRAPPPALELAMPDTIVCRCEEVTLAEIDEAATIAGGAIGAVKLDTRLGMGRCQGRYCAPLLAQRLRAGGAVCDDDPLFAPRAPAKPVPLAAIARREVE